LAFEQLLENLNTKSHIFGVVKEIVFILDMCFFLKGDLSYNNSFGDLDIWHCQ
jgi:hypothetical protein